jgi:hypothetical protein
VLRSMSRRWRTGGEDEGDVPYGPPPGAGPGEAPAEPAKPESGR